MQDNRSRISQIPLNHFDQETKAKIGKEFNSDKREIFFSSAVLLVEGSTEKGTYPLIAQKLDHNFNEANIFVCDVGGVTSFKLYIAILNSFNIPFVCVCDEDHEQYVKNLAGDNRMLVNRPDFEGVLKRNGFEHLFVEARNIVGNKKPRVARYVITKIIEENQEIPKEFENVINKIYDVSQIKK